MGTGNDRFVINGDHAVIAARLDKYSIPEPNTGCVLWFGSAHPKGYGHLRLGGRKGGLVPAYRAAYILEYGPIPPGLCIDHLCRQPACINPRHLEPVTNQVNCQRGDCGKATGALYRSKIRCKHGHPFNKENTYIDARGYRACRECKRLWMERNTTRESRREYMRELRARRRADK